METEHPRKEAWSRQPPLSSQFSGARLPDGSWESRYRADADSAGLSGAQAPAFLTSSLVTPGCWGTGHPPEQEDRKPKPRGAK